MSPPPKTTGAPCVVLRHPAFGGPPIANPRLPGRKRGAVCLAVQRRKREAKQLAHVVGLQVDQSESPTWSHAEAKSNDGAKVTPPAPPCAGPPELATHEAAVIAAALAILDHRLRAKDAVFREPADVKAFLRMHLAEREREAFGVMFCDAQHKLISFEVLFEGTLTQTSVYPREVVRRALALNAGAVILSHNHPSGSPEPSAADQALTRTLKSALALVEVVLLDHVVIGGSGAVSLAERGML